MKRWHQDVKKMKKESKIAQCPWFRDKLPPKPLGKFRKRHALDCGKKDCCICHYDKIYKVKSHKDIMEDLRTKEQLNEMAIDQTCGKNWHRPTSCVKDVNVIPK